LNIGPVDRAVSPGLPFEIPGFEDLPSADGTAGDEDRFLRCDCACQWHRLSLYRALMRQPGSDQHCSATGEDEGHQKKNQSACAHWLDIS